MPNAAFTRRATNYRKVNAHGGQKAYMDEMQVSTA